MSKVFTSHLLNKVALIVFLKALAGRITLTHSMTAHLSKYLKVPHTLDAGWFPLSGTSIVVDVEVTVCLGVQLFLPSSKQAGVRYRP